MYKILINGELFVDSRTDVLRVINPVIELEVNTAGTLTMTVPQSHPYYDKLVERQSCAEVYMDSETEPVFAGCLASYSNDFYNSRTAVFEGELSYLNDSIQRPAEYSNKTVRQLLEAYIAAHNSSVEEAKRFEGGMVTVDGGSSIHRYTNWNSTMTEIAEDLIDNYGGYLRVRHQDGHRYLDYLADSMHTATQTIRLGENLLNFTSNLDTTEICTVLIPLGATIEHEEGEQPIEGLEEYLTIKSVNNNKDYLESSTAIAKYGRVEKTMRWDDVATASALKTKGEAYLTDVQFANVYIEANAIDLHYDNPSIERIKLMDTVRVISEPHGLNRTFMLTKMTINLDNPGGDTFTLGVNVIPSLSATSASLSEKMNKIDELPNKSWVNSAVANATALITGNDGGYVVIHKDDSGKPYEVLVMDTDNIATAQKVWRWNQSGFGYSSTGYNGTYGTAITMDGSIVADFISSGTLNASLINADDFEATNGNFTNSFNVDVANSDISKFYTHITTDGAEVGCKALDEGSNASISFNIDGMGRAKVSIAGDRVELPYEATIGSSTEGNYIIHSGNIEEQSVNYANTSGKVSNTYFSMWDDAEGGNLELLSPNRVRGIQMDLFDQNSFRMYLFSQNGDGSNWQYLNDVYIHPDYISTAKGLAIGGETCFNGNVHMNDGCPYIYGYGGGIFAFDGNVFLNTGGYSDWLSNILTGSGVEVNYDSTNCSELVSTCKCIHICGMNIVFFRGRFKRNISMVAKTDYKLGTITSHKPNIAQALSLYVASEGGVPTCVINADGEIKIRQTGTATNPTYFYVNGFWMTPN